MKNLKKLMLVLLISQSLLCFFIASPVPADNGGKLDPASLSAEKAALDIQAKCKAIDQFTSYRKVEVSPKAAAEEGNASDILAGYYDGNTLRKIATHAFGDKGVGITEYYFDNDQLIFVSWHTPSYEGKQPKEGFGQFYFKDGKLIEWMDIRGKVINDGMVKAQNLYGKREITVKGWADQARERIEADAKG